MFRKAESSAPRPPLPFVNARGLFVACAINIPFGSRSSTFDKLLNNNANGC